MLNHPEKYPSIISRVLSRVIFSMRAGVFAEDKYIRFKKMRMYRG